MTVVNNSMQIDKDIADKLYTNLSEAGKQIKRLRWLMVSVSLFFAYLAFRYYDQPMNFEIAFLGKLSINKTDVVLMGPVVVSILSLALLVTRIYEIVLHRKCISSLSVGGFSASEASHLACLLKYPRAEVFFATFDQDRDLPLILRTTLQALGFAYNSIMYFLPIAAHSYLLWRGTSFSPNRVWDTILLLSLLPLGASIFIAFHDQIVTSAVFAWTKVTAAISHLKRSVEPAPEPSRLSRRQRLAQVMRMTVSSAAAIIACFSIYYQAIVHRDSSISYWTTSVDVVSHADDEPQLVVTYRDKKISDLKLIIVNVQNDGELPAKHVTLYLPSAPTGILETSVSYHDGSEKFYRDSQFLRIANKLLPSEQVVVKVWVTGFTKVGVKDFLQELRISHDMGVSTRRRGAP